MEIHKTSLAGVLLIKNKISSDNRGIFFNYYRYDEYSKAGMASFVQSNLSRSTKGVLRGLHYQLDRPQAKLVMVVRGEVFDVVVDVRVGSPTFGHWFGEILSDKNRLQLYVPAGFAHGFCTLSAEVDFLYQCSDYYHPQSEKGIRWNDDSLGINWPIANPILSAKDMRNLTLKELSSQHLPVY